MGVYRRLQLPNEFYRELDPSRLFADRRDDRQRSAETLTSKSRQAEILRHRGVRGIAEIRVIENIEELRAKLDASGLTHAAHGNRARRADVGVPKSRAVKFVAGGVPDRVHRGILKRRFVQQVFAVRSRLPRREKGALLVALRGKIGAVESQ